MFIDEFRNVSTRNKIISDLILIGPGVDIFTSKFHGPFAAQRDTQVGADADIGRYTSFSAATFHDQPLGHFVPLVRGLASAPLIIQQTGYQFSISI